MQISIVKISSANQLQLSRSIRYQVFVEEQSVPEEIEYDEFEEDSHHYLAFNGDLGAATCRWRETDRGIKLERFAVLKDYRGRGLGAFMVRHLLKEVLPFNRPVYLHAQVQVVDFYSKLGFRAFGNEFEEAGIMHYLMEYLPKTH